MRHELRLHIMSRNQFSGRNWRKYRKYADQILWIINGAMGQSPALCTTRKRLKIVSVRSDPLDRDNLWGGVKPIPDALKRLGWIIDDTERHLDLHVSQRQEAGRRKNPLTIITLTEAEPWTQ